jgi:transcriptional regulator with XRE-family HTH domain
MSEELGKKIRGIRLRENKTQAEFALGLGITDVALSRYERGLRKPKDRVMEKLVALYAGEIAFADRFGVTTQAGN